MCERDEILREINRQEKRERARKRRAFVKFFQGFDKQMHLTPDQFARWIEHVMAREEAR